MGGADTDECLIVSSNYAPQAAAGLARLEIDPMRWAAKVSLVERFKDATVSIVRPERNYGATPMKQTVPILRPPAYESPSPKPGPTESHESNYPDHAADWPH
jgi:hypothetical protein